MKIECDAAVGVTCFFLIGQTAVVFFSMIAGCLLKKMTNFCVSLQKILFIIVSYCFFLGFPFNFSMMKPQKLCFFGFSSLKNCLFHVLFRFQIHISYVTEPMLVQILLIKGVDGLKCHYLVPDFSVLIKFSVLSL